MQKARLQQIAKALGDPMRMKIFERIAAREELACADLKARLPITPATLSHHIKELTKAGLIKNRREGKCTHLSANPQVWRAYLEHLKKLL